MRKSTLSLTDKSVLITGAADTGLGQLRPDSL